MKGYVPPPLSKYLDSFLQPFVIKGPTYIRYTKDFINNMEGFTISIEAVLFIINMVSLYINIPCEEAWEVVEMTLEKRNEKNPPTYFLMELVDIILEGGNYV